MPTIRQLPHATQANSEDQIPISQAGETKATTVGALLSGLQPAIIVESGTLLGRTSVGPGGPEPVLVGPGLAFSEGVLKATAAESATGAPGPQGPPGKDGASFHSGAGAPQPSSGFEGDSYL